MTSVVTGSKTIVYVNLWSTSSICAPLLVSTSATLRYRAAQVYAGMTPMTTFDIADAVLFFRHAAVAC